MKKLVSFVLAALVLCACFAFAEGAYIGDMQVINCREWVSFRSEPSTESERIMKIPVDSIVYDCYEAAEGWVYGLYCGEYGYVSTDYLTVVTEASSDSAMLCEEKNGVMVVGSHEYTDNGEFYYIIAYDEDGNMLWMHEISCSYTTELQMVDAFIAGTDEKPMVMAFSAETGLTALDFFTGETLWEIKNDVQSLGGSICYAVDTDGTMYIGGYYGPDPLAISADGEILWRTDFKGVYYWLHTIEVYDEHLICYFDMDDTTYEPVIVMLAKNGDFMGLVYQ